MRGLARLHWNARGAGPSVGPLGRCNKSEEAFPSFYLQRMTLTGFHPVIARWFSERIGEPTPAQRKGWESIRAGRDTLIAAPTGSGKTLAAFLSALDELLRESLSGSLPDEVRVIYVSPLKALSADIHKNLAEPRR